MYLVDQPPDPDWYSDHVLAVLGPHGELGPARQRQGDWNGAVGELIRASAGTDLSTAVELAATQGLVLRIDQARACGLSDARLRRLVRRREWSRPRRGVLSPLPPEPSCPARSPQVREVQPHGLSPQVRAAAAVLVRPGAIASNECAGAMHGLPLLGPVHRPTIVDYRIAQTGGRPNVQARGVGFDASDLTTWFGVPVTTVARTVVDVARNSGMRAGLVMSDAALTDRLTSPTQLLVARRRARYRPGVRNVDRVLELTDWGAESPLESLTRCCLVAGGLPAPELQIWVDTARDRYRVDMLYREQRVIIEADGELKYRSDDLALVREKRRQEALERADYVVIRVSWWELVHEPQEVVARVWRKLVDARVPA